MRAKLSLVRHKAYRYRVEPTAAQAETLARWESKARALWNAAHAARLLGVQRARCDRKYTTLTAQSRELTDLLKSEPWLAEIPRNALTQVLSRLDLAWQRCLKGLARRPRFKSAKRGDVVGFCETDSRQGGTWLRGHWLHFPKLPPLRVRVHRPLEGRPKRMTLKRDGDQWFVSLLVELDVAEPEPRGGEPYALDLGVRRLWTGSDGQHADNPAWLRRAEARLRRAQRTLARRQRGSKRQRRARSRVARLHRLVRRQRLDHLHVQSTRLAKNHGVIVLEDLRVDRMTRTARGTVDEPGTAVRAKAALNRAILDAGWGLFGQLLAYKLEWSGGQLLRVAPHYTSQTCAECGHTDAASRFHAAFACTACGHTAHADTNAARNIQRRGQHALLAVEGSAQAARRSGKARTRLRPRVG